MSNKIEVIRGYKAFNKDMTCNPGENRQQYKEGEIYEFPEIKICKKGAHFCENPLDLLSYYDLCDSVFHEVESSGKIERHLDDKGNPIDSKITTSKIRIGARLGLKSFIEIGVKFVLDICKTEIKAGTYSKNASAGSYSKNASSRDYSQNASAGYNSKNASSGSYSQNASAGDNSKNASSGDNSQNASAGYNNKNASSGDNSQNASAGDNSQNASAGSYSKNASAGDYSKNASAGSYSTIEMTGKYNVGAAIGKNSRIKGIKGNWITLAEYEYDSKERADIPNMKPDFFKDEHIAELPLCVKSAQIDGKKIKENVWYELKGGEFEEIK